MFSSKNFYFMSKIKPNVCKNFCQRKNYSEKNFSYKCLEKEGPMLLLVEIQISMIANKQTLK